MTRAGGESLRKRRMSEKVLEDIPGAHQVDWEFGDHSLHSLQSRLLTHTNVVKENIPSVSSSSSSSSESSSLSSDSSPLLSS